MRRLSLLLTLALWFAAPAPAAEVGRETLLTAEQSIPWRGVGRVNVAGTRRRGMCTGTLIAPDLVLTAAHCLVHGRTGQPVAPGNVHFVAGWHKGTMTGSSVAARFVLHPDWVPGPPRGLDGLATDLALVRLRDPLPPAAAVPFAVAAPPLPGDPVTLVSYRRDRAHALTLQDGCVYRAITGRVLRLDCPVARGASGAPVFAGTGDRLRVVAVLTAMGKGPTPTAFAARADTAIALMLEKFD